MSINKLTADLNIIQTLDNQPSLTPEQLKAKFDEAVNIIKDYINNTLVDGVNSVISQLDSVGTLVDESIQDKLEDRYHVGSVIIDYTNTNPATYLGFGTWQLCAVGKMFVGVNTSDTDFNTSGKTGGAKTVTLTTNQIPAHKHTLTDPGHVHHYSTENFTGASDFDRTHTGTGLVSEFQYTAATTKSYTGISMANTGGGQAHNNMPPYETVYKFRRVS
jgi:microcystin-dependent protein